jgi:hypothetical protein
MKFEVGQIVKHVKTGGIYHIIGTPKDNYRLEHNNQPAYLYQSIEGDIYANPIWVRSQSEMEDGRFVLLVSSN